MPIDASIPMQVKPFQAPDRMNMMAQVLGIQQAQNQNAMATYSLGKAKRQDEQTNALMTALQGGLDLSTPEGQSKALSIAPDAAQGYIKARLENQNTQAQIGKHTAETKKAELEATFQKFSHAGSVLSQVKDDASYATARQMLNAQLGMNLPEQYDPTLVQQTIAQGQTVTEGLKAKHDQLTLTETTQHNRATEGNAAGQLVEAGRHNRSTEGTAAAGLAQSDRHFTETIKKDYAVAGMQPGGGGGLDDNSERTAQAIASGQLPAPTGMALLNPKNQRILGRVMEINPQYDSTTVSAKRAAATAFTTGQQGNALRSVSTANAHLDQLNELVDALGNGNTQVINKVQNYFSKQTGNANVTNFDAIKNIVGQEVVKAIVAGGGGVGEREEAAKIFSNANSPQQLKGAIQHYRMVMGAQANNLMEQRRAAGLPDSTLPNYAEPGGTHAAPGGMPSTSAIDAELARRGGK